MTDTFFSRALLTTPWPTRLSDLAEALPYRESRERNHRKLSVGVLLSILFHAILLLTIQRPIQNDSEHVGNGPQPIVVRLNQPVVPPTASSPVPPAAAPESRPTPPPPPRRQILAVPKPAAQNPVPLEPPPPPLRQPEPAAPTDFSSMLDARRAQRKAAEEAIARTNAAARAGEREPTADEVSTANINRNLQTLAGGGGGTGGVFRILFKGHRSGQFAFNGWTPQQRNNWREVIEVEAGPDGNVELAMVRRMIELIRKYYQGDFHWESQRLGRVVTLSARKEDSAGLEAFLMLEFFRDSR